MHVCVCAVKEEGRVHGGVCCAFSNERSKKSSHIHCHAATHHLIGKRCTLFAPSCTERACASVGGYKEEVHARTEPPALSCALIHCHLVRVKRVGGSGA
jgi:hypothetical protein